MTVKQMSGRDRMLRTLNHEEPDRIPLDIGGGNACGIAVEAYRRLVEHLGLSVEAKLESVFSQLAHVDEAVCRRLGIDARRLSAPVTDWKERIVEEEDHYWYVDEWHRKLKMPKERGYYFDMVGFPLAETSLSDYQWPDPMDRSRYTEVAAMAREYRAGSDAVVCMPQLGNGFLQMGAQLYGYDKWFMMLALEPAEAERFLDVYFDIKMQYWDTVLDEMGDCIDLACETDDLGTQQAPIVSVDMWRRFVKPRNKKLYELIKKKADVKLFYHSCGSVYDFIPDLIEIGVEVLNPVQVTAAKMDTKKLKREFGKDLVFWGGGIDTQFTLPHGTREQIETEVKRRIDDLAPGGGFVFAPVHNIQADVPPENIMIMLETLERYGSYR